MSRDSAAAGCRRRPSGPTRLRAFLAIRAALLLALLPLLAVPAVSRAAREFEKVGTIGAQFLKIPIDPRGSAMGNAFTAVADDASAVFWNPAGLARLDRRIFAAHHSPWLADVSLSEATLVTRIRYFPGVFAFSARTLSVPAEPVRTVFRPEGEGTTFDAGDLLVGLSYARSLTDKFSAGIGVNWLQSTLATYTAQAVTFDFGTMYDTGFRSFRIGMAIQNIGSDMTYVDDPVKVPTVFRVGMSARIIDRGAHRLLLAGDFSHPPDNNERANVGLELSERSLLFLRGGWFFGFDSERASAGAGLRLPALIGDEVRVDYGYTEMKDLPAVQRFGAEIRF